MNLLLGSLTIGLFLSLLGLGVYVSFRIFDFPDITADGSITLGAAVAAVAVVVSVHEYYRPQLEQHAKHLNKLIQEYE